VVTGGRRGTARIWSVDGKQLVQLRGHTGEITDVAFSPDGNRVATSSRDATARTWDATTGRSLQSFTGHRDDVNSVVFSADGRLLLTASRDHDGRLWDVETGTVKQVLRAHYGEVADASFSPDGRWILTAGPAAAYLWQQGVRDPVLSPGFGGHESRFTSAVFDPSSRFVLTASSDGTVRRAECLVCRDLEGMLDLARVQLAETRRTLTEGERERYGLS
jgi:WD40 repeat protein